MLSRIKKGNELREHESTHLWFKLQVVPLKFHMHSYNFATTLSKVKKGNMEESTLVTIPLPNEGER